MKDLSKAERRDRCYECGAKGHQAAACPTKRDVQRKAVAAGDSPASSTVGTNGRRGTATARGQRGSEAGEGAQQTPALQEFLKQNEELVNLSRMGLLDSGATHPLRARTVKDNIGPMDNVNVTLAGENRVQMEENKAGTILSDQNIQPIVPLGQSPRI